MRFSLNWLRHWVPTELDAEAVADRLTNAGLEVDRVETIGAGLDGVVVGRIRACEPHPDADRLRVCEVDYGAQAPVTIVCGAPNARAGLVAPLATVGTELPGGLKIKPAKLRGVASNGMLCSAPELGLGQDAGGLMELPDTLAPGRPLAAALGLPDHVIEVDLTPNRADCLSIRGVARELAAIEGLECRAPVIEPVPASSERGVPIELIDPAGCPRYVGRVIEGVDPNAPTPAWMVERLERCGVRSLGPIVDTTNYVMLELGQPMHAFDLARLSGGIRVRRAQPGDEIELLDGQRIEPDEDMLLICDHERPVALAGIMGGEQSAVHADTRDILLESAWFNPAAIIGKGRRYGLVTDSAHRFERGVDPQLQATAIERATALIVAIAGGRPGPVLEQRDDQHLPVVRAVGLRVERVNRVLGTGLRPERIREILERLGMQVEETADGFEVTPPSARRDIEIEVDLIEEVARLAGYDNLPAREPRGRLRAIVDSEREIGLDALRRSLQARGFNEIMTWSFVAAEDLESLGLAAGAQPLANPLSQDLAVLRTSLLPGLLRTAAANLRHQQPRLKLFETGHVFAAGDEDGEADGRDGPGGEWQRLGLLLAGRAEPENWLAPKRPFDFYDLKGEIEHLLGVLGHRGGSIECRPAERAWLHPGQGCAVRLSGETIGYAGQLHPARAPSAGLDGAVFVAELDLDRLRRRELPGFAGLSRYPSVRRDLAMVVPESVPAASLVATVQQSAGEVLEKCIVFDQYQGGAIESGYKSVAIGLILRDVSRTLTDDAVDSVMLRVTDSLKRECNATIRT